MDQSSVDDSSGPPSTPPQRPQRAAKQNALNNVRPTVASPTSDGGGDNESVSGHSGSVALNRSDIVGSPGGPQFFATPGRGRKRKQQLETSVGGADVPTNKRGRGGGAGRGRGRGRGRGGGGAAGGAGGAGGVLGEGEDDGSLFGAVKHGKAPFRALIDQWMEDYQRNTDTALVDLLQFFISSSGCRGVVTQLMIHQMEYSDIIRKMTEEFEEESGDYPLVMTGAPWKKFRHNFCEFIRTLIEKCKEEIIFDQRLMDSLIQLLTTMADSQVRAFRHTATLAAMKLCTELVARALELAKQTEQNARQLDSAKQKQQAAKGRGENERYEYLIQKKTELQNKTEEIRQMIQYAFRSVFVHRYRDILPEIRSICIQELGNWLNKFPDHFLEDSYLKYIGWTLHDKVAEVRQKCLHALLPLYEFEEGRFHEKLKLFTHRFAERLVSLVMDKDADVGILAIKVINAIFKIYKDDPDMIEPVGADDDQNNTQQPFRREHKDKIYDNIYCSNRHLAVAAGEFVSEQLFAPITDGYDAKSKRGKPRSPNTPLIIGLLDFFIQGQMHDHATYLVDSLLDTHPMMKDWECMTDLLLEEPGVEESALSDRGESALVEIMVCAIKQSSAGELPPGRQGAQKKTLSNKEQKAVLAERERVTDHFVTILPQLLKKYGADKEKVANLLQIAQYFDLKVYVGAKQEKHLDGLLKQLEAIVEKHSDDLVLKDLVITYLLLSQGDLGGMQGRCETALSKLIDTLVVQLNKNYQQFMEEEMLDEEDAAAFESTLRKIATFFSCHDLTKWDLWNNCLTIAFPQDESKIASVEVRMKALCCCSLSLRWDLTKVRNEPESAKQTQNIKKLAQRKDEFLEHCVDALEEHTLKETLFVVICDLLMEFGWALEEEYGPTFAPLVGEVTPRIENRLSAFIIDAVFADPTDMDHTMDQQRLIGNLHKRRSLLASYCKLVINGILGMTCAAEVFRNYTKFYQDFGDILKHTMAKCREMNKLECARCLADALISAFEELKANSSDQVDPASDEFQSIRDLAKRFALMLGPDQTRNREAVATIHREGILYALGAAGETRRGEAPVNIYFLEIVIEFSGKLMPKDKTAVVRYLDRHCEGVVEVGDSWQSLQLYRNSLVQQPQTDDAASVTSGPRGGAAPRGRGRGRGRPPNAQRAITPATSDIGEE